ncbi:hypothetical protein INR49_019791 [Caranx melampygus]|nr:hypothetical protein INR49_019791 [Caranx melampygus]
MCSDAINITVTGGPVILESPARPVQEGEDATLRCRTSDSNANSTAGFYKDDLLIGTSSTGNITIRSVSKADEGLYKCDIGGVGESKSSWLTVRGQLDPEVSYTDVTFTQEVQVRRDPGNTDQQLFFSSSETTA